MKRITLGLLLVLGLCSGCNHLANNIATSEMTQEQYAAIDVGMSEDKVRGLAGEPDLIQENAKIGGSLRHPKTGSIWYYKDAEAATDANIYICFQNGAVVSKDRD